MKDSQIRNHAMEMIDDDEAIEKTIAAAEIVFRRLS